MVDAGLGKFDNFSWYYDFFLSVIIHLFRFQGYKFFAQIFKSYSYQAWHVSSEN